MIIHHQAKNKTDSCSIFEDNCINICLTLWNTSGCFGLHQHTETIIWLLSMLHSIQQLVANLVCQHRQAHSTQSFYFFAEDISHWDKKKYADKNSGSEAK